MAVFAHEPPDSSSLTLTACTVSSNSAASIERRHLASYNGLLAVGAVTISDTIVAGNTAGTHAPDVSGAVSTDDRGYNLIGDGEGGQQGSPPPATRWAPPL